MRISVTTLSVEQENELMLTSGFAVWRTHEEVVG